jgi:ribulose-bisphosphate carboxylase large chain
MTARLTAVYRVRSGAAAIEARAKAIAVEQSVEMPLAAIDDETVLDEIVGRVEAIADRGDGTFDVRIGLAVATTGLEAGQLMNMLFGNTSIHDDVELADAEFPPEVLAAFGGPRHGLDGLRRRAGAAGRAMTCSALKPQGLPAAELADLAYRFALGGLDFIKDDHGLGDQSYSPFAERVAACAAAVARANREIGGSTRYVPSLTGDLDRLRRGVETARRAGLDTVLVTPMIAGLANLRALIEANPDVAFMAHPALAGAARIAPPFLLGKLFRLLGLDATVFPNYGGRFGYSPAICRDLAAAARDSWSGPGGPLRACVPVPAGGMTPDRVPEMLDFFGPDTMFLIGGGLLSAGRRLTEEAAAFVRSVAQAGRG